MEPAPRASASRHTLGKAQAVSEEGDGRRHQLTPVTAQRRTRGHPRRLGTHRHRFRPFVLHGTHTHFRRAHSGQTKTGSVIGIARQRAGNCSTNRTACTAWCLLRVLIKSSSTHIVAFQEGKHASRNYTHQTITRPLFHGHFRHFANFPLAFARICRYAQAQSLRTELHVVRAALPSSHRPCAPVSSVARNDLPLAPRRASPQPLRHTLERQAPALYPIASCCLSSVHPHSISSRHALTLRIDGAVSSGTAPS